MTEDLEVIVERATRMMTLAAEEHITEAVLVFIDECRELMDGFMTLGALAAMVGHYTRATTGKPGAIHVEMEMTPDASLDEEEQMAMHDVAAFVAAGANRDIKGGFMVFQQVMASDVGEIRSGRFVCTLIELAGKVMNDAQGR